MQSLPLAGGSVVEIHYITHPKPLNSQTSKFLFEMSGVLQAGAKGQWRSLSCGMHILQLWEHWQSFTTITDLKGISSIPSKKVVFCMTQAIVYFYCFLQKLVLILNCTETENRWWFLLVISKLNDFIYLLKFVPCFCLAFLKIQVSATGSCTIHLQLEEFSWNEFQNFS